MDVSKTPYYDEIAGLPLPEALVKSARAEELEYMTTKLPVWQRGFSEDYVKSRGLKPVPTRFLDVNKGGWDSPDAMQIRSRLVVQETRRRSSIAADDIASVFSATPPIEALRFMLSQTMSTKQGFSGSAAGRMCSASLTSPGLTLIARWLGKYMSHFRRKRSQRFPANALS